MNTVIYLAYFSLAFADLTTKPPEEIVDVKIYTFVQWITAVEPAENSVVLSCLFSVNWTDSRLASERSFDSEVSTSSIWIPDLRIFDGIDGDKQLDPKIARVSPDGTVRLVLRRTVSVWCFFEFKYYPYDYHEQSAKFWRARAPASVSERERAARSLARKF